MEMWAKAHAMPIDAIQPAMTKRGGRNTLPFGAGAAGGLSGQQMGRDKSLQWKLIVVLSTASSSVGAQEEMDDPVSPELPPGKKQRVAKSVGHCGNDLMGAWLA